VASLFSLTDWPTKGHTSWRFSVIFGGRFQAHQTDLPVFCIIREIITIVRHGLVLCFLFDLCVLYGHILIGTWLRMLKEYSSVKTTDL
jgi:hypothetical protein